MPSNRLLQPRVGSADEFAFDVQPRADTVTLDVQPRARTPVPGMLCDVGVSRSAQPDETSDSDAESVSSLQDWLQVVEPGKIPLIPSATDLAHVQAWCSKPTATADTPAPKSRPKCDWPFYLPKSVRKQQQKPPPDPPAVEPDSHVVQMSAVDTTSKPQPLFTFPATVQGNPAVALLDSGAGANFISTAAVKKWGLTAVPAANTSVRLVDGTLKQDVKITQVIPVTSWSLSL
jgi:hypothetical protein